MENVLHRVSQLVDTVDDDRFDRCLFDFFDDQLSVAQCTVFLLPHSGAPRVVAAEGRSEVLSTSAKALATDYAAQDIKSDPNFGLYLRRAGDKQPAWQHYTGQATSSAAYRVKFYDEPSLRSDMTLSVSTEQGMLLTSLYRTRDEREFSPHDQEIARPFVSLYLSLIRQHLRSTDRAERRRPHTHAERRAHVKGILSTTTLSARESEICSMIVLGHTTHGISLHLGISENTVATHRKRAYSKLGIATQNELFQLCLEAS